MYDLVGDKQNDERRKFFNIKIEAPKPGSIRACGVNFMAVEPEESKNGRFSVFPT